MRAEVERIAPTAKVVYVTGASRLTPGLEAHVIAPNDAAKPALRELDIVTLARALHHALAIDPFYRRHH